jgi:hypothetical protein
VFQPTASGQDLHSIFFSDVNTGYACGNLGRIIKTTNGGVTWTELYRPCDYSLWSVCFTDSATGYLVGEAGTILKTTNGGGFPVDIHFEKKRKNQVLIYPNPANEMVTIRTPFKGHLSMWDLKGRVIYEIEITQETTTIKIGNFASGVYLVNVIGDNIEWVGKIIME